MVLVKSSSCISHLIYIYINISICISIYMYIYIWWFASFDPSKVWQLSTWPRQGPSRSRIISMSEFCSSGLSSIKKIQRRESSESKKWSAHTENRTQVQGIVQSQAKATRHRVIPRPQRDILTTGWCGPRVMDNTRTYISSINVDGVWRWQWLWRWLWRWL